jgi:hypothetical protein
VNKKYLNRFEDMLYRRSTLKLVKNHIGPSVLPTDKGECFAVAISESHETHRTVGS